MFGGESGDVGGDIGEVGVHGEEPAETDRANAHDQPYLTVGERREFTARVGRRVAGQGRQAPGRQRQGKDKNASGQQVCRTPPLRLTQPRHRRDPDDLAIVSPLMPTAIPLPWLPGPMIRPATSAARPR